MNQLKTGIVLGTFLMVGVALAPHVSANVASTAKLQAPLGNDEDTFTFVGKCPNGNNYRIVSYQVDVSGTTQSFYDYEGPVGKGKVSTSATPKLAEIINQNYWE